MRHETGDKKKDRLPDWLRKPITCSSGVHLMKRSLRAKNLSTVCEEARCPNIGECFGRGTATFMIMGNSCTRRCTFCAVNSGEPKQLDEGEPIKIAEMVKELGLKHVVITSVTRDDLPDGGASHFAKTIKAIKNTKIEVLIPDFNGSLAALKLVCEAGPDVLNHNVETVRRLTPFYRDSKSSHERSLSILKAASQLSPKMLIKSGLMVGLGESHEELEECLKSIHSTGCKAITIGQYLRPTKKNPPAVRYVTPDEFRDYEMLAYDIGFSHVFCGPLVRSSYMADSLHL